MALIALTCCRPVKAQDVLRLGDAQALPGAQAVDIPLLLDNKAPVAGLEFTIRDDSAIVQVTQVICSGRAQDFTALCSHNKILLFHLTGGVIAGGTGEIAVIRVTLGSPFVWAKDSLHFAEPVILANQQGVKVEEVSVIGSELTTTQTGITDNDNRLPSDYALQQNYPNPFNPATTIRFAVAEKGEVTLALYNLRGELAATIVNKEYAPGYYSVPFSAGALPSGLYFCKMTVNGFSGVIKMAVVR